MPLAYRLISNPGGSLILSSGMSAGASEDMPGGCGLRLAASCSAVRPCAQLGGIGGAAGGAGATAGVAGTGATAGAGGVGGLAGAGCCACKFAAINNVTVAAPDDKKRASCDFVFNMSPPAGFGGEAKQFSKPFNAACQSKSYLVWATSALSLDGSYRQ